MDAWVAPKLDTELIEAVGHIHVQPTLTSKKHLEKEINPRKNLNPPCFRNSLGSGFFLSQDFSCFAVWLNITVSRTAPGTVMDR